MGAEGGGVVGEGVAPEGGDAVVGDLEEAGGGSVSQERASVGAPLNHQER